MITSNYGVGNAQVGFSAKVLISKKTKARLRQDINDVYEKCAPSAKGRLWEGYNVGNIKKALEQAAEGLKGKIKLVANKHEGSYSLEDPTGMKLVSPGLSGSFRVQDIIAKPPWMS